MKLGKRTAKLVREAAIAGFVAGNRYGPDPGAPHGEFPGDAQIWIHTLRVARKFDDIYPALSRVAAESEELTADDHERAEALREYIEARRRD